MTHSENYFDLRNHNNRRFPVILYNLIESSDPSIISWTTSGDAFQIHNSEFLVRFVVPYFFCL